ncbi:hypothetical protein B0H34DRAFT_75297 [Crassisporium funariophilum]|nr:hypothetical protein B0H34DRAFT_75297 [Crassisporium funariophilum]
MEGNEAGRTHGETKALFVALTSKISLSLDAWTSSNCAFLAVVAHYVTDNGHCKELFIDFCELVGEHSKIWLLWFGQR